MTNPQKTDLERYKELVEMEFMVIDRLKPETRAVIHEEGSPSIATLISLGFPGPMIISTVDLWADEILMKPKSSQPHLAA